jgi:hypothetical protein
MLHPTQNHTYKAEMERKNIYTYMYHLLLILIRTFQLKQKWFFFLKEAVRSCLLVQSFSINHRKSQQRKNANLFLLNVSSKSIDHHEYY